MQQDYVTFTKSFRILDLLPFRILKREVVLHTILGHFAYNTKRQYAKNQYAKRLNFCMRNVYFCMQNVSMRNGNMRNVCIPVVAEVCGETYSKKR